MSSIEQNNTARENVDSPRSGWKGRRSLSRFKMLAFVLVFAAAGIFLLWKSFAASSSYDSVVLGDHPVAYWAMANPAGTEADLTGNGHTGTYKGGAPTATTMINGDGAVVFNGSSQYMTVPTSASFSIPTTHKLTWEGWIRPDDLQFPTASNGYVDWMGKCANYSPSCEWESRMYTTTNSQNRCNRLSVYAFNPGAGLGSGADWQPNCNLLKAGQWLYVVGEYQTDTTPSVCSSSYPGTIDIWVNGVKWNQSYHGTTGCMSQYNVKPVAGSSPLNIGTMALDYWFKGAVGKVAVYNYLLTQDQISSHFVAMTGAQPSGSCANTCTIPVPTQTGTLSAPGNLDTTPPAVSISAPAGGAVLGGTQTITADASDNVGVSKVEFYNGTTLLGSAVAAPYTYTWNTAAVANGTYGLSAKAYDTSGNTGTSSTVNVTVSNSSPPADTMAPSIPSGLKVTGTTDSSVNLAWSSSSDNVGVKGYKLYRYGPADSVHTLTGTSFTDTGLAASTGYTYTVSAFDAAGNESPQSAPVAVTTQATPLPPATSPVVVTQTVASDWNTGYCANLTIRNTGGNTITRWSATIAINGKVTSLWDANWSQSGSNLTISNKSYNGTIKAGQYKTAGFCASK